MNKLVIYTDVPQPPFFLIDPSVTHVEYKTFWDDIFELSFMSKANRDSEISPSMTEHSASPSGVYEIARKRQKRGGRKPDVEKRELIGKLLKQGLTIKQIQFQAAKILQMGKEQPGRTLITKIRNQLRAAGEI